MPNLYYTDLGRAAYEPTLRLQKTCVRRLQAHPTDDVFLLLVEHDPPVITFGRRGRPEHLLASPAAIAAQGIEIHHTRRGGQVTYHGPGQLVGYPILALHPGRRPLRRYVRGLEEALIRLLRRFDIPAGRADGLTGVWVADEKIAAIGIALDRWVAYHGFALNVCPNLAHFDLIVPCGLARSPSGGQAGGRTTSMSRVLGRAVSISEIKPILVESLAEVLRLAATRLRLSREPTTHASCA